MTPKIVGVIFSRNDLRRAARMRKPPDFFEVRLDAFANHLSEVRAAIPRLRAPLIITARDPREGGANNLAVARRRELLIEFLPLARYVDVELRSAPALRSVLEKAAAQRIDAIISFHDFERTPRRPVLERIAARARSLGGAFLKVATRTNSDVELRILLDFVQSQHDIPVVAMGIGRLGRAARIELAHHGCPLNYGYIGKANVPGQLSVEKLRTLL
jgi:3-dehydroquinate dehydratase-1